MSIERAVQAIEKQQEKVKERSAAWMVGEQLKDICRAEPDSAELIARDLEQKDMGIADAEKQIKAFADKHRAGSFSCVTPVEADRILREFYGLGERADMESAPTEGQAFVRSGGSEPPPYERAGTLCERGVEGAGPYTKPTTFLDLADFL